ncbi:MAG: chorismate-binding protein [Reichenbachiella sp.]
MNKIDLIKSLDHTLSFEKQLSTFFLTALSLDLPFAIWRKPNTNDIEAICQLSNSEHTIHEIEDAPEGFLFCPFNSDKDQRSLIHADLKLNQSNGFTINPGLQQASSKVEQFVDEFSKESNKTYTDYLDTHEGESLSKEHFVKLVEDCIKVIETGDFKKIVPSRNHRFQYGDYFDPIIEFQKLCKSYSNAFVSMVYMPSKGLWLGATPELLISSNKHKFKTVSLAGTQPIPDNFKLSNAAWKQKEIEEQALVSRYIINCFKKIRLREFEEYGPKTVKAGNLMHLKTTFEVDMDETNFPQLATVMLDLLHPTSAVCGMPMKESAEFLKENEDYDRTYFSGYLGPISFQEENSLYVNLRCARLYANEGVAFAGAGVTEDSDPVSEWNETEIKLQTLLNIFES